MTPDIITLGKGLTGGFIPLGVCATTLRVAAVFRHDGHELRSGSTYGAVACAATLANIGIVEKEGLVANAKETGAYLRDRLIELQCFPLVAHSDTVRSRHDCRNAFPRHSSRRKPVQHQAFRIPCHLKSHPKLSAPFEDMATYPDHIGLFRDELAGWLPEVLFDAHLHLGPPAAVNSIAEARRSDPLTTFSSFTHEELLDCYGQVFSGCRLAGAIAFPFPLREVNYETANRYLADVVRRDPRIHGFILSNPTDTRQTIAQFEEALSEGVRFRGVKPYYDLLGRGAVRSVYDIRIEEFVPDELLEFMNHEKLIMMLHTSRIGMGDPECQQFVRRAARQFPDVSIILAHMGRYLEDRHFFDFLDSGIAELPSVYLEMSSATSRSVYLETLRRPPLHDRLLFGADLPFGLITGQEFFSAESGPTFLTRDDYAWTDKALAQKFRLERLQMTYNTWHTVRAFKCALEELDADEAVKTSIKERVFRCNAESLLARGRGHSQPDSSSC